MAKTDSYVKVFLDESTINVTDDAFRFTVYAYTRHPRGGTYSTNVEITIDPLTNDATQLAAIKQQVVTALNSASLGRTFTTTQVSVFGQFA